MSLRVLFPKHKHVSRICCNILAVDLVYSGKAYINQSVKKNESIMCVSVIISEMTHCCEGTWLKSFPQGQLMGYYTMFHLVCEDKLFKQHIITHECLHTAMFKYFFADLFFLTLCVCQDVRMTDWASSQISMCENFGCSILDSRGSALCKLFSGGILVVWKFILLSSVACLNFHLPLVG